MGNPFCEKCHKLMRKSKHGNFYKCPNPDCPTNKDLEISKDDIKIVGEQGTHPTQMTFNQKIQMFRNMRRRKQKVKEQEPIPSFSPTVVVPDEESKIVCPTYYRCKDCKEIFEGEAGMDKCIACDSKNIEVTKEAENPSKISKEEKNNE